MRKWFSLGAVLLLAGLLSGCYGMFGGTPAPWWWSRAPSTQPAERQVPIQPPVVQQQPAGVPAPVPVTSSPLERPPLPATQAALAQAAVESGIKWGEGSPFYLHKGVQSRAQLAQAIRSNDRSMLRVKPEDFLRQIAELGLPVPAAVPDFADWLERDPNIVMVACTPALLREYYMGRTNREGTIFDMKWSRLECGKGEFFLAFRRNDGKAQVFISLFCGNVLTPRTAQQAAVQPPSARSPRQLQPAPVAPSPRPPQAAAAPAACQTVLRLRLWDPSTFSAELRQKMDGLIAEEQRRPYFSDDQPSFSRTMGRELAEALRDSKVGLSPKKLDFVVSIATVAPNDSVLTDKALGAYTVADGVADVPLPDSFEPGIVIRVTFPLGYVMYPLRRGNLAEGRVFSTEIVPCKVNVFGAAVLTPS